MKINKFWMMAMLLSAMGAGMTSCSDSDEKVPETVEDPIKNTVEYYVEGKVSENGKALAGATVKVDGGSVTTDENGLFTATITEKGTLTLSASKDGYLSVNGIALDIPDNAENRSSYTVNFNMTKKANSLALAGKNKVLVTADAVTENGSMSNVAQGTGIAIPAGNMAALQDGTTISMTNYVPEQEQRTTQSNSALSSSIMNMYVETNNEVSANGITLAIKNPTAAATTFKNVAVYANSASRAGEAYAKLGEATLNASTQSFEFDLQDGKLANDYSFRINAKRNVSGQQLETIKSEKIDNSGNFEAKKDVKISYTAPMGWTYTKDFDSSLDASLVAMMKNAIVAQEGPEGTYTKNFEHTTNVGGNCIMYYNAKSTFTTTTYTFELTDRNVSVEVKKYTGTKLEYVNESADQHSGGTSDK